MIMMVGVEGLPGKFLMQTTGSMLVDVNHNGIGLTEVVFSPEMTVRYAAFDDWFVMAHFLSPRHVLLPRVKSDILRLNAR
ncbi:hypothetical protein HNR77_001602 [Paenibacillus sp. JGP012]|nr:hypothetical protein [Paenibacillus sp. JGP012]